MSQVVLITGGAGFVGSHVAIYLKRQDPHVRIISLDNLYRQGSQLNVVRLKEAGVEFIEGDIRYSEQLMALPKIDCLIECSAEPSVMKSYDNPSYTIDTNLIGTLNCLELVKRDCANIIYLSTSRVYPFDLLNHVPYIEKDTRFEYNEQSGTGYSSQGITTEFSTQGAKSLYGATKLCSEHLITEYMNMYDLKGVINRFGVIAGPWQMGRIDQGIIGFWIFQHMLNRPLSYIGFNGDGKQARDVLHIDDVCELIEYQITHMDANTGQLFNVGGGKPNTVSLMELTVIAQKLTGNQLNINGDSNQRRGDVRVYMTDNAHVTQHTPWSVKKNIEQICVDTYRWMADHKQDLIDIL